MFFDVFYSHARTQSSPFDHYGLLLVPSILGHGVERTAILEPLDLTLVECVREFDIDCVATIGGVNSQGHGLANSELSAGKIDAVIGTNLVVVGWVRESQRKHTLLLQVGLVLIFVSCSLQNAFRQDLRYERRIGQ